MHIVTKTEGMIINKICQLENCNKYDHNDFIRLQTKFRGLRTQLEGVFSIFNLGLPCVLTQIIVINIT